MLHNVPPQPTVLLFLCNFRSYEMIHGFCWSWSQPRPFIIVNNLCYCYRENTKASVLPKNTWGRVPVWRWNGCVSPPRVKFKQTDFQGDGCALVGAAGWPPACMVPPLGWGIHVQHSVYWLSYMKDLLALQEGRAHWGTCLVHPRV